MRLRRQRSPKNRIARWLSHTFLPHKRNHHRPWILHPHGLAMVAIVVVAIHISLALVLHFPIFPNVLGESDNITPTAVLEQINIERQENNLAPLQWNDQLSLAAQQKGQDMLQRGYWAHTSPSGEEPWDFIAESGYTYSVAGENLARNFHSTEMMLSAWMASPTHRANIVHTKYADTGIAVLKGTMNGKPTTLVVQLFGTPEDSAVANAPELPQQAYAATQVMVNSAANNASNVLGAQLELTPVHFYRAGILTVLAILLGVLTYDMLNAQNKKLKRNVGKNLAHIILLIAVITTVLLAESGSLL
ncbi:CAP domain-containing protein [Candidatus Woesebacteria bacterium]|nr:CAP domain-containing protein [Candidatus Woesebacteria bacterium]MCD8507699.1 CAP domain-containing protein [Candidatus Woesebacteria bacterium]MCD8527121.1 CAP domain-containing protein [Candidatus Woesebacteria bacterium]MCD8546842.1 CAP domain-containing protein [Candidatus Woesebacteria bacterium]